MVVLNEQRNESRIHKLVVLAAIFNGLFLLLLFLIQPVFVVLWLLLTVLVCLLLSICKPPFWQAEMERMACRWSELKQKLGGVQGDPGKPIDFCADHVLECQSRGQYPNYRINKTVFLIGRSKKCDCPLTRSDTVSSQHCRIHFCKYSQEYYIEDLRSKNGTYIGTRRLEPYTQEKLLDNAEIRIGDCCFRFVKG